MIEPFDVSFPIAVAIGVLAVLSFAMGLLAILEAKALSRPRRRRSTWT
jgi:hypothetical protein